MRPRKLNWKEVPLPERMRGLPTDPRLTEARETQGTVLREVLREDRAELRIRKETLEGVLQELKDVEVQCMGRMKHEHHETINEKPQSPNPAEEEYYAEMRRHQRNKAMRKDIPTAPAVTPRFEGRRDYPANPATDAQRFEKACRAADKEASRTGVDIVVFKNRENQYLTWELRYISKANPINPLYTAKAPEVK